MVLNLLCQQLPPILLPNGQPNPAYQDYLNPNIGQDTAGNNNPNAPIMTTPDDPEAAAVWFEQQRIKKIAQAAQAAYAQGQQNREQELSPIARQIDIGSHFGLGGGMPGSTARNARANMLAAAYRNAADTTDEEVAATRNNPTATWGTRPDERVQYTQDEEGNWIPEDVAELMQNRSMSEYEAKLALWLENTGATLENFIAPPGSYRPPTPKDDIELWQRQRDFIPTLQAIIDEHNTWAGPAEYRNTDVVTATEQTSNDVATDAEDWEIANQVSSIIGDNETVYPDVIEEPGYVGESFRMPRNLLSDPSTNALLDSSFAQMQARRLAQAALTNKTGGKTLGNVKKNTAKKVAAPIMKAPVRPTTYNVSGITVPTKAPSKSMATIKAALKKTKK